MPKIYHFTKLNTAIEFILPSMTLRSNFLNKMNGPSENQKWAFGGIDIDYERAYPGTYSRETHIEHQWKLGEEIKSKLQVLCFVHSEVLKGFENEMMWAQYSDNHKGVCLELDLDLFLSENRDSDIFKFENITYDSSNRVWLNWNSQLSKEENIDVFIKTQYKKLFLSKSHFWEKEYEKRLLILSDEHCNLSIEKSLTGVYLGLSTNPYYQAAIEQFVNVDQTDIFKVYFEQNRMKRMQTSPNSIQSPKKHFS